MPENEIALDRDDSKFRCRVCGWLLQDPPWGPDGRTPTFKSCPCCGVEFGYEDFTPLGAARYRHLWLQRGGSWAGPEQKPSDWDLEEQLKHIPQRFLEKEREPDEAANSSS